MPIYHVVLFRLKPGVTQTQLAQWSQLSSGMVGKIPGLLKISNNPPLSMTAHRAKGFNMGLVAILEKASDLDVYAKHPAHLESQKLREELCEDTLAYDMEFEQ